MTGQLANRPVGDGRGDHVASFAIGRLLKGKAPETVDVRLGGECDAQITPGVDYLIYGTVYQGRLNVNMCTYKTPVAEADAELRAIEALQRESTTASIHGHLETEFRKAAPFVIRLRGQGSRHEMVVERGPYEFNGLKPGSYELTISRGRAFQQRQSLLLKPEACTFVGALGLP